VDDRRKVRSSSQLSALIFALRVREVVYDEDRRTSEELGEKSENSNTARAVFWPSGPFFLNYIEEIESFEQIQ